MKQSRLSTAQDLITEEAVESSATNLVAKGSVLLVTRSGILAHSLPVAVNLVPVALNQDIKAVTPHPVIEVEYLYSVFRCFERDILNTYRKGGTTVHSIEFSALLGFEIPLPPLNEQKRIVAKIEELFSELDAAAESLRKARRQLGVYRQSLLKQAFEGKLTARWRAQNPCLPESSGSFLARIESERRSHFVRRIEEWKDSITEWKSIGSEEKRPSKPNKLVPSVENIPVFDSRLPKGWLTLNLSQLILELGQGWSPKCESRATGDTEWGVIKTTAIQWGKFDPTANKALPRGLPPRRWLGLNSGDILITRAGPRSRCGVVCRVPSNYPRLLLCDKAYRLVVSETAATPEYVEHLLCSPIVVAALEKLKTGINDSGVNITQSLFLQLSLPLPPLGEQKEIVRLLGEHFEAIDQNEREIDAALTRSQAMRQSILKKAFTGKLVAQDPADEPASELLARIRAERAATTQASPKRRLGKGTKATSKPGDDLFPEVPSLKSEKTDLQAGIVALSIDEFQRRGQFLGHTIVEKVVHLSDYLADLKLDRHPIKDAAGPNDFQKAREVEARARAKDWFTVTKEGDIYTYHVGRNMPTLLMETRRSLGSKLAILEKLLTSLKGMNTQRVEVLATVFAAWNNLLLLKKPISDETIVLEARENWHEKKLKIPREQFLQAIEWIKKQGFVPMGTGQLIASKR